VAEEPEYHLLRCVRRLRDERGWTVLAEVDDIVTGMRPRIAGGHGMRR
jgi:hypothetical protein